MVSVERKAVCSIQCLNAKNQTKKKVVKITFFQLKNFLKENKMKFAAIFC